MKIIYLHQYFNTNEMPGSTRSFELSKRLVENGHKVYLITSKRDDYQLQKNGWTKENGIDVYWTPVSYSNKMGFLRRIFSFLLFSIKSLKVTLSIDADIIYATSTPLTIAIPAIIYSRIKAKPMIFGVRDLWPEIPIAVFIIVLAATAPATPSKIITNPAKYIPASPKYLLSLYNDLSNFSDLTIIFKNSPNIIN